MYPDENTPPITGQALEKLAREYLGILAIINRLAHRYDASLLNALVEQPTLTADMLANAEATQAWLDTLLQKLNTPGQAASEFTVDLRKEASGEGWAIRFHKRLHGVEKQFELNAGFLNSGDYRRLRQFGQDIEGIYGSNTFIAVDEKREHVRNFPTTFDWMMAEAKKGQHIQRYKGLGEMNPDQLFETTLDSNTRRLLQVKIEDAMAADEIFTTLMGDQVEPRRDFIEKNALEVSFLDI